MKPTKLEWEDVTKFEEVKGYGQHIWRDEDKYYLVLEEGTVVSWLVVYELPNELFALLDSGERTLSEVSWKIKHDSWPPSEEEKNEIRKDRARIEKLTGLNCAIFFEYTTFYIKEKLLEEGIPFVLKDKQVYLPFIGYLLSNENERKISPVHLISFLTQKVILVAIYEKWENVTASKAAIRLGVTKMSANRCFDEIEYLNVDILGMKGKSRVITVPADIQKLWNDVRVILRNPVIARYELKEDIQLGKKAGITALCEYSLLSDNEYPTYAITKKEITESGIRKMKQVHSGEEIGCVVLELGYFIDFKNKKLEDPLSVTLSLTESEKQDERIGISIKRMLEEYVW